MPKKFSKPHLSRIINGDIPTPEWSAGIKSDEKVRLDRRLTELYPEYSRSDLQRFIKQGAVALNGTPLTTPNTLISPDETPLLTPPPSPDKPALPIIYEDDNVLVIDKPIGLLSMSKGAANPEPTLENYGLLVHRLDRDTSGVVILAKNEPTRAYLQKQFQNRTTHKIYYALVEGAPKLPAALIDLPMARNLKKPTTFLVDPNGREAKTEYKVLKANNKYSLLELRPKTGRTHQLRVHLSHIGTPILGDAIYNRQFSQPEFTSGSKIELKRKGRKGNVSPFLAKRLYLHAHSLEITIPAGERKIFTSPLPKDFSHVLE
jgi:23S rRNA pseudouridine1911/1915/1917 synthase